MHIPNLHLNIPCSGVVQTALFIPICCLSICCSCCTSSYALLFSPSSSITRTRASCRTRAACSVLCRIPPLERTCFHWNKQFRASWNQNWKSIVRLIKNVRVLHREQYIEMELVKKSYNIPTNPQSFNKLKLSIWTELLLPSQHLVGVGCGFNPHWHIFFFNLFRTLFRQL
jgi:hypothetical protein